MSFLADRVDFIKNCESHPCRLWISTTQNQISLTSTIDNGWKQQQRNNDDSTKGKEERTSVNIQTFVSTRTADPSKYRPANIRTIGFRVGIKSTSIELFVSINGVTRSETIVYYNCTIIFAVIAIDKGGTSSRRKCFYQCCQRRSNY